MRTLAALAAMTIALSARAASAQCPIDDPCSDHPTEDLRVDAGGTSTLSGAHVFSEVHIAGTLAVAGDDGSEDSGWLWLRAARIEITAGGRIEASGKGYTQGGPGAGTTLPMMATMYDPQPGGGGAHAGAGGRGLAGPDPLPALCMQPFPGNECQLFPGADGGIAYDADPLAPLALTDPRLALGSAGGASNPGCPNEDGLPQRGKNGGGVVILTAGEVIVDGVIAADGTSSNIIAASGPGAGAGGSIVIQALSLRGSGQLSARGGDGVARGDTTPRNSYGGAGGGGLISLMAAGSGADAIFAAADVSAGTIGACASQTMDLAAGGQKALSAPPACIDADGDGHEICADGSAADCDDGRAAVHPGACETCNGLDDDCSGAVDDAASDSCDPLCPLGSGSQCIDGSCQQGGEGGGGGAGPAADPPRVRLGGGLCSLAWDAARDPRAAWPWLALGLALLCRRRAAAKRCVAPER